MPWCQFNVLRRHFCVFISKAPLTAAGVLVLASDADLIRPPAASLWAKQAHFERFGRPSELCVTLDERVTFFHKEEST